VRPAAGSFIPPAEIAKLRDLTRYRSKIIGERVRETQRVQKLLDDAGIKLDSVVTDVLGVSGRRMLEALIAGERDPDVLAEMALARMRSKIGTLREALVGRFDDHHALLLRMHLDHIDELDAMEARLDGEVNRLMGPFAEPATRLLSIPGVGKRVAETIVAETDMSRFPTDKHLASWTGLCPGHHESAGKRRSGKAREGNPALRTAMCEAAWAASHSNDNYLVAQFRRFKRRFGTRSETKAIFAVAHTMIVIVWHILASDDATHDELGANFFERRTNTQARQRHLVRQLEALGNKVTLEPAVRALTYPHTPDSARPSPDAPTTPRGLTSFVSGASNEPRAIHRVPSAEGGCRRSNRTTSWEGRDVRPERRRTPSTRSWTIRDFVRNLPGVLRMERSGSRSPHALPTSRVVAVNGGQWRSTLNSEHQVCAPGSERDLGRPRQDSNLRTRLRRPIRSGETPDCQRANFGDPIEVAVDVNEPRPGPRGAPPSVAHSRQPIAPIKVTAPEVRAPCGSRRGCASGR